MSVFRRRVPTWLLWLLVVLVPFQLLAYVNLEVSYKYEVDLAETMVRVNLPPQQQPAALQELADLEREIRGEQRRRLVYAVLAGSAAVGLAWRNARLRRTTPLPGS